MSAHTSSDAIRDADGRRLCEYCGQPVPESLGTKPRRYCSRSHRQRAYEARRTRETVITAVAVAVSRDRVVRADGRWADASSRDDGRWGAAPSRDVPGAAPTSAEPKETVEKPNLSARPVRRRLVDRERPAADPLPLWEDADGG